MTEPFNILDTQAAEEASLETAAELQAVALCMQL